MIWSFDRRANVVRHVLSRYRKRKRKRKSFSEFGRVRSRELALGLGLECVFIAIKQQVS